MGDYADDAIERGIFNDTDDGGGGFIAGARFRRCKYCGEHGLTWGMHKGKWRLIGIDGLHVCRPHHAHASHTPEPQQ